MQDKDLNILNANKEALINDFKDRLEYFFCDQTGNPIHRSKVIYKGEKKFVIFPYSYSRISGLRKQKISEIQFLGWDNVEDLPSDFLSGDRIRLTAGRTKVLMAFLRVRFPNLEKITIVMSGKTKFLDKAAILNWSDMHKALVIIDKEKKSYSERRRVALNNQIASTTTKITAEKLPWKDGALQSFLSAYQENPEISQADADLLLSLISLGPQSKITITTNFIETRDRINTAYLEDVLAEFDALMKSSKDNEKEWQDFFEKHGWVLNHLFPFEVILHGREAYVGGKTFENKDGKVVDFLFSNGFKDNYALLEIKTHNTMLLKGKPYRGSDVFAAHDELSGAISQCLDQKKVVLKEMSQKNRIIDPKSILIIGRRSSLADEQRDCFELIRANQKSVDITTFDELREKIVGLLSILKP